MYDCRVAVRPLTRLSRERRRKRQCSARPLSRSVLLNGSASAWSHLGSPSVTTATRRRGAAMPIPSPHPLRLSPSGTRASNGLRASSSAASSRSPWARSRLGGVHHPAPAVAFHPYDPRLLGPQALGVGVRRLRGGEPERRHGPVRPDAPDRPPR